LSEGVANRLDPSAVTNSSKTNGTGDTATETDRDSYNCVSVRMLLLLNFKC